MPDNNANGIQDYINIYKQVQTLIDDDERSSVELTIEERAERGGKRKYNLLGEKVREEISRDLKRTHTSERMKTSEG